MSAVIEIIVTQSVMFGVCNVLVSTLNKCSCPHSLEKSEKAFGSVNLDKEVLDNFLQCFKFQCLILIFFFTLFSHL